MKKNNYIELAKKSANTQINELKKIKRVFNHSFINAVNLILKCKGKVIFSGVGKNSFICKKAAATFSSVGIPSFFVDPTGDSHGDAGQIEVVLENQYLHNLERHHLFHIQMSKLSILFMYFQHLLPM